eukprot:scaffold152896_cov46-Tisochrysis_lutea.AAC.1
MRKKSRRTLARAGGASLCHKACPSEEWPCRPAHVLLESAGTAASHGGGRHVSCAWCGRGHG